MKEHKVIKRRFNNRNYWFLKPSYYPQGYTKKDLLHLSKLYYKMSTFKTFYERIKFAYSLERSLITFFASFDRAFQDAKAEKHNSIFLIGSELPDKETFEEILKHTINVTETAKNEIPYKTRTGEFLN